MLATPEIFSAVKIREQAGERLALAQLEQFRSIASLE
jgi:hypothetical protein